MCVWFYVCPCDQEAEEMHIKAIQIKEQLLGHEDYEVALSVGHLASLYNYDMNQYDDAERLYLRSIAIGQSQGGRGVGGFLVPGVTFYLCLKKQILLYCKRSTFVVLLLNKQTSYMFSSGPMN